VKRFACDKRFHSAFLAKIHKVAAQQYTCVYKMHTDVLLVICS
jgi:hypothetical protein